MKTTIVLVLVCLIYGITALPPYYLKIAGTQTNTPITHASGFHDSITVTNAESETFNANLKVFLYLDVTHSEVAELSVSIINPAGVSKQVIVSGRDYSCHGKNIDATFSDVAQILSDDVLERCDEEQIPFYSGNLKGVELFTPVSGTNQGEWKLNITDECTTGVTGTLNSWALIFAEDVDNDTVPNSVDNCPTTYNPYVGTTGFQADENQNGIGNECECDCLNFKDSAPGKKKVCLKLENWGYNKRFYKGQRKNPGDWAEAVVKNIAQDTFQPGDYSYTHKWLDCHCNEIEILP